MAQWVNLKKKYRLFSTQIPSQFVIPTTLSIAKIYPTRLEIDGKAYQLPFKGPCRKFTVFQDLEKNHLEVQMHTQNGYVRYFLIPKDNKLHFVYKKGPKIPLPFKSIKMPTQTPSKEKLFLGSHKKQQIEKLRSCEDLIPIWHKIAINMPKVTPFAKKQGPFSLEIHSAQAILDLYHIAFDGGFVPQIEDTKYLGYQLPPISSKRKDLPFAFFTQSASQLRALFFKEEKNALYFLPHLLPEFHTGKFVYIESQYGHISFEWSKKFIRKVLFVPSQDVQLTLHFQKKLKSCRQRHNKNQKGVQLKLPITQSFEKDKPYLFDRFQK
ncbi:MAG: hypothetical protein K940chlam8_00538 [Chlamydiae bacterium]|nr:hypothetical protein [Chlamydiota bacterium]